MTTERELRVAASDNLTRTYLALGLATPKSEVHEEDGFISCVGEFDHPICNFAARLNLDPWSARRLYALASSRGAFNVYHQPGDGPEHASELLERSGFRATYRLVQMVAEPLEVENDIEMVRAGAFLERVEVARFMADQFFSRQSSPFRRKVAEATGSAAELNLYSLLDRGLRAGAIMLCEEQGMLGIYNLCVSSSKRGRGLGGSIVRWALDKALHENRSTTLQCDPRLEGWYECFGFRTIGAVDVYNLSKDAPADIIEVD